VGSLRHGAPSPLYRGLFDLLPPDVQQAHAELSGDESLSPVKRVPVLTRSQFLHRKAQLQKAVDSTIRGDHASTDKPSVQVECSQMEAWALEMGQILVNRL
jgi:hypothetical protein